MRLLWFLVVGLLFAPRMIYEQSGILRGVVADEVGAILPHANVLIQHWRIEKGRQHPTPEQNSRFTTDAQGRFSIELAPGLYDVFISYPTLSPTAQKVRIQAAKETVFDVQLRFSPLVESADAESLSKGLGQPTLTESGPPKQP